MNFEKVFYLPGDLCEVKHDIPNKPVMIVKNKASRMIRAIPSDIKKESLLGIVCYWFSTDLYYHEQTFSTKDLHKV